MLLPNPAAARPYYWPIVSWFIGVHMLAAAALWYMVQVHFVPATLVMAVGLFFACHLSITMGLHRLYAHNTYQASRILQAVLLVLASGVFQITALHWAGLHRRHHQYSDTERDPYSVIHGFWWAHMGWVLRKPPPLVPGEARDLMRNRLILWQQKYYWPLAFLVGLGLPTGLGWLWNDPLGGLLAGGFLRLAVQYHFTWVINSWAHSFGTRRYENAGTARTNWWLGVVTVGESHHERHHLAPNDYRLGNRWYDLDLGKWCIWLCSKVGLASGLKRDDEWKVVDMAQARSARR